MKFRQKQQSMRPQPPKAAARKGFEEDDDDEDEEYEDNDGDGDEDDNDDEDDDGFGAKVGGRFFAAVGFVFSSQQMRRSQACLLAWSALVFYKPPATANGGRLTGPAVTAGSPCWA
jgi:hypothetical protein